MADKNDFSEIIAEVLIELQAQRQEQQKTNEILTRLAENSMPRQGFENFANAVLDKFDKQDLDTRALTTNFENFASAILDRFDKQEQRDNRKENLLQKVVADHESRIQKLERK